MQLKVSLTFIYFKSQYILISVSFFLKGTSLLLYISITTCWENWKKNAYGTEQVKVVWPKFNNREATAHDMKGKPNFGKIYFYM